MRRLYDFEDAAATVPESDNATDPGGYDAVANTPSNGKQDAGGIFNSTLFDDPLGKEGVPGWGRGLADMALSENPITAIIGGIGPALDWLDPNNNWHQNATAEDFAAFDEADRARALELSDKASKGEVDNNTVNYTTAPAAPPVTVATAATPPVTQLPAITHDAPPPAAVGPSQAELDAQAAARAQQRAEAAARGGQASTQIVAPVTPPQIAAATAPPVTPASITSPVVPQATLLQSGLATSPTSIAPTSVPSVLPLPPLVDRLRGGVQSTLLSSGRKAKTTGGVGTRTSLLGAS